MNTRRIIERRSRIFLGCEGESEQAYGTFLQKIADENGLSVHVLPVNLQPAGDPLALAQKAVRIYTQEVKKGGFAGKAILLDADRLNEPPNRGKLALKLLADEGFTTIWQKPDHEGLLLRHFDGHMMDDPPRGSSMAALQMVWAGYHKNFAASDIKQTLSLPHVQRAASVIPALRTLLNMIGFA